MPLGSTLPLGLAIAGLAFAVRLVVAIVTGAFQHPQTYEYHAIATALLDGKGFLYVHLGQVPYYAFTTPLYPWLSAGVYALTQRSVPALLMIQMGLSALHAGCIGMIAARYLCRGAGMAAGILMALHPGLAVYSSLKVHPLTLDALLFTLMCWQWMRLRDHLSWRQSVCAGLVAGLAMLSRSTAAVLLLAGAGWLLVTASRAMRRAAAWRVLVVVCCALAVVSPWVVRNLLRYRSTDILMQSTGWEVFWRGNNPNATGHSYVDSTHRVLDQLPPTARAELEALPTELDQARWFRERAMAFLHAHPYAVIRLWLNKWLAFWWCSPQMGLEYPTWWRWGYQAFYILLLILSLVGTRHMVMRGLANQRALIGLIGLWLVSLSTLQSFYYVEGRHRWAVEPLLIIIAGAGLARIRQILSDVRVSSGLLRTVP